jgi:glyoxylase-like metal-dependent hydrolase (beta-lactamase superfamily II)
MQVHHLNAISSCPFGGKWMDGATESLHARLSCHCLLVEAGGSLVLVDTGYGLRDVATPVPRLSWFFLALLKPDLREEMTAFRQIQRLGLDPEDVRDVVLTHLDFDHAGGLDDFPWARVHLLAEERDSAIARKSMLDRMRYRPAQWSTRARWHAYPHDTGERWFGLECVRDLEGVPDDILMVPLLGHTLGHAGVAVRQESEWLLLSGDAYMYRGEMDVDHPSCTPGLALYQTFMEKDRKARLANQEALRALRRSHGSEVRIVCSHDVVEFERSAGHAYDVPATHLFPRPGQPMATGSLHPL